jgi:hypothetical protein
MNNIIILRTPYKITKAYLCPCRIPNTQRYPECVRRTDKNGDMILSRDDIDSGKHFIADTDKITIWDGKTFNLDDDIEAAQWEAIKYHKVIAKSRDERDEHGELIIDGNTKKYGTADWYVEVPGQDAVHKNKSRRLKLEAQNHIANDTAAERLLKAKVLGRYMKNAHDSDVEDFLMQEAEKNPQKIINLYTGGDMQLRLLFIKAKDEKVIVKKENFWMYGDTILGTTDESVIIWMKQSKNKKLLQLLQQEAYPELYVQKEDPKASKNDGSTTA